MPRRRSLLAVIGVMVQLQVREAVQGLVWSASPRKKGKNRPQKAALA